MCMGKPSHVLTPSGSLPVDDIINTDNFTLHAALPHSVLVDNLKIGQIHHVKFEPSELDQYRLSPPSYYDTLWPDQYGRLSAGEVKTEAIITPAPQYYNEKSEELLPLPVTTSIRQTPDKLTRASKVLLLLTLAMMLHIAYQCSDHCL